VETGAQQADERNRMVPHGPKTAWSGVIWHPGKTGTIRETS